MTWKDKVLKPNVAGKGEKLVDIYMSGGIRRIRILHAKCKLDTAEYRNLLLQEVFDLTSFKNCVCETVEEMEPEICRL